MSRRQPDLREVAAIWDDLGDDDRDTLSNDEFVEFTDSGLTLDEWLHPEAALRREREREG